MSEEHLFAPSVALVPSVWPLGWGLVMCAVSINKELGLGVLQLRAASDQQVASGKVGGAVQDEDWQAAEAQGAPTLTLGFKNAEALRKHIALLQELLAVMENGDDER